MTIGSLGVTCDHSCSTSAWFNHVQDSFSGSIVHIFGQNFWYRPSLLRIMAINSLDCLKPNEPRKSFILGVPSGPKNLILFRIGSVQTSLWLVTEPTVNGPVGFILSFLFEFLFCSSLMRAILCSSNYVWKQGVHLSFSHVQTLLPVVRFILLYVAHSINHLLIIFHAIKFCQSRLQHLFSWRLGSNYLGFLCTQNITLQHVWDFQMFQDFLVYGSETIPCVLLWCVICRLDLISA